MTTPTPVAWPVIAILLAGGGLVVLAAILSLRPRDAAASLESEQSSFGWTVIAGLATALLCLGVAVHGGPSDGLRSAVVQLLAVALAAALGYLCLAPGRSTQPARPNWWAGAGRGLAWLTLVGLPPTLGFPAKVMLYRALLSVGWGSMVLLAMAVSAAALIPALIALRSPAPAPPRGLRSTLILALAALVLLLGLYPQPMLDLAGMLTGPAGSP